MKIMIALPTKSSVDPLLNEGTSYLKKLRPPLIAEAVFLSPKSFVDETNKEKRMKLEGEELLKKTAGVFRIALTDKGKARSSEDFCRWLESLMHTNKKIAFIIGGAFGLAPEVVNESDATLSLSSMTMPHRLAFLVLCEQLYRSSEIMINSPYHK